MRSRAARLTLSATAWIALGVAAYFLVTTEQKISGRGAALRTFDLHAREVTFALADARAGQQAYVAAGQSSTYWMPKVTALVQEVANMVDALRGSAVSGAARMALLDASASIADFGNIDKRVRDYLGTGESLMASDVVFSEGGDAAARASLQVETARIEEHQAFDADEASLRLLQAYAMGGAVGLSALILAIFGLARGPRAEAIQQAPDLVIADEIALDADTSPEIRLNADPSQEIRLKPDPTIEQPAVWAGPMKQTASEPAVASSIALKAAAELCTEFGRMHDLADLKVLLGRAARLMDASGLVVWLGNTSGADLQPVMAHGYSDQVLELMRPVPRTADNAAAAAYRSSTLQIVSSRPGQSLGAVVAPLLSADGCIGALTAEIRDGSERSEDVQSLASIFAAQLAGVITPTTAADANVPQSRTAGS